MLSLNQEKPDSGYCFPDATSGFVLLIARKGAFIEACRLCYKTSIGRGETSVFIGPDKEMLKYAEMGDLTNLILADSSFKKRQSRFIQTALPAHNVLSGHSITTGISVSLNMTRSDR